jgi:ribosomal protein S18 acetylase RimI-like enzyme
MRKRGFTGIIATVSHHTIGYLTGFRLRLIPSLFYMDQLFIDTDYRGLKIGKRLLAEAEKHLKSHGITCIFLLTKSQSDSEKFYIKNNYAPFLHAFRIKEKLIYFKHICPKNTGVL